MFRDTVGNSSTLRAVDGGFERFRIHDEPKGELEGLRITHLSDEFIARSEESGVAAFFGIAVGTNVAGGRRVSGLVGGCAGLELLWRRIKGRIILFNVRRLLGSAMARLSKGVDVVIVLVARSPG